MILEKINDEWRDSDGKRHVVADINASTAPSPFPTTGKDVKRLSENDILETGSTIYAINAATVYMMNEEHEFKEQ